MVKTFPMAQSSKIGLVGIYYQIKPTFSEISKQQAGNKLTYHILYTLQYLFIECCNARFLDKTEIKIIKIQSPGHNAYTSNSKKRRYVYNQTISL